MEKDTGYLTKNTDRKTSAKGVDSVSRMRKSFSGFAVIQEGNKIYIYSADISQ